MVLDDSQDKAAPMETSQESIIIKAVIQDPPISKGTKGNSTQIHKRKNPWRSGGNPQSLGLCPEFRQYYYSIGFKNKQEFYMILEAIRCKLDVTLPPDTRLIPQAYFTFTIPILHDRAAVLLRNVVGVNKTSTSNLPTQPTPVISTPPLVQPHSYPGTPNFGTPQHPSRGLVPHHYH